MNEWSPSSWSTYNYEQAAHYPNEMELVHIIEYLSELPPLVYSKDILQLKNNIARAGRGEVFILQGGDCAESFLDCRRSVIQQKLKILLQMSLILRQGLHKPIICIGRMAGQYAKPRSQEEETIAGLTLPCYRGDLINRPDFNLKARIPNPKRLLQAYHCTAITLHYIHSLLNRRPHASKKPLDFFTSHEALHLHYEQAITRQLKDGHWYNLSTHLPWIGMRTAKIGSAHVELLRGIQNPIGIKIGLHTTASELQYLIDILNPQREEGRLLLITRLGAQHITTHLPPLITAIKETCIPVTWSCDPMHGNTEITKNGIKTRHFDTVLSELQQALYIHKTMNSTLGGVHFELTGDNVTECLGGARGLTAHDLKNAYHSLIDPRLNYEQSLEMATQLSQQFNDDTTDSTHVPPQS